MSTTVVNTSGSCIHGVAYSKQWTCAQCDRENIARETARAFYGSPPDDLAEVKRDLRRIIELLEQIAGIRR